MEAGDKRGGAASGPQEVGEMAVDPRQLAGSLLRKLADIPWVGLGAIGTAVGVALLYAYFRSIDFMPSDIPSILGASVFVALLALGFYLWVVFSLIAPLWTFREGGLPAPPADDRSVRRGLVRMALPALQFLGVGLLFVFIGVRSTMRCEAFAPWLLGIGVCVSALGALGWAAAEWATAGQRPAWWRRLAPVLCVCLASVLPFWVFWEVLARGEGAGWWSLVLALALWVAVACWTGWQPIPVWAYALLLTVASLALMWCLPILLGHSAHFPATVAQMAGIRAAKADELRVPTSTCLLIQSALGERSTVEGVHCDAGEWGAAHARVLSSFGPRWLIEVQLSASPGSTSPSERMRLTIPGEGVHLVRPQVAAPRSACSR